MTYLQLVNGVLSRLREPLTTSVLRKEDPVVNLVKDFVNDAKRQVESANRWNATREAWIVNTKLGQPSYILPDSCGGSVKEVFFDKRPLRQYDVAGIIPVTNTGRPIGWAIDGTDESGNLSIRLGPIPDGEMTVEVLGWRALPDMKEDGDMLRLPDQPVLYYALALAARERGEVGGQTATELMGMAQQFIRDAAALDATLSPTEQTWAVV
jgi:hypothetical protein